MSEKTVTSASSGAASAKADGDKASAQRRRVYRKTSAGEDAIVQRAKVEERQQRMILVLIDGKASVQELSAKIGDLQMTEEAIAALEKNGLIEFDHIAEEHPSTDAPHHKPSPLSHFSTFGEKSAGMRAAVGASARSAPPSARLDEQFVHSQAVSLSSAQTVLSDTSILPPPARPAPPAPPPPIVIRSTALPKSRTTSGSDFMAEALVLPVPIPDPDPEPEFKPLKVRKPLRETHPRAYVWVRYSLMALGAGALCVTFVMACVLLYPYNSKRSELEARLARVLGVPVSIGQVTPNFSDWRLELRQVRFGETEQSGTLESVYLPGVFSWLFFETPDSSGDPVELMAGSLEVAAIIGWLGETADGAPEWLRFSRLALTLGGNPLAVFEGELRRDAEGRLLKATLKSAEPYCQMEFLPPPAALGNAPSALAAFTLDVSGWLPSARFPARLDHVTGKGKLYPDRVVLEEVNLFLLNGQYKGRLEAGWRRDGLVEKLQGQGVLSRLQIAELMRVWGIANGPGARGVNLGLNGELSGALRFQTQGDTLALWRKNLNASGELNADNAVLQGIDLVRLVYSGSRGALTHNRNAATKFQKLSIAAFRLGPEGFTLQRLQSRSSVMHNEEGEITVAPNGVLSGYARLFLGNDNRLENTLLLNGRYPGLRTELIGPINAVSESSETEIR